MKKILFSFLTIIFSVNGFGQITFQKTIALNYAKDVIQKSDTGYIVLSAEDIWWYDTQFQVGGYWYTGAYSVLSPVGDYLHGYHEVMHFGAYTKFRAVLEDYPYYIIGGILSGQRFILKADNVGDTIWLHQYNYTNVNYSYDILEIKRSADSSYIFITDAGCIKINFTGDTIWSKLTDTILYVTPYEPIGAFRTPDKFLITTADSGFIIFKNKYNSTTFNYEKFMATKYNSSGNVIWVKQYIIPPVTDLTLLSDSSFVITANDTSISQSYIIKLDTQADSLWMKNFVYEQYNSIEQTLDGGYIIACGHKFKIIKTNFNADTLWTSILFEPDSINNGATHARETSDHGFIVCGFIHKYFYSGYNANFQNWHGYNSTAFVIKTDSLGINIAGINEINKLYNKIEFFPNPATNLLTIDNGELEIEVIEIYNTLGETVCKQQQTANDRQQTVDVSQLPSGIYFVKITGDDKEVRFGKFIKQ